MYNPSKAVWKQNYKMYNLRKAKFQNVQPKPCSYTKCTTQAMQFESRITKCETKARQFRNEIPKCTT